MPQNDICWSCKGPLKGKAFFCETCGSLQKPFAVNPFELFEVPVSFTQNMETIEKKYLTLQQQFHPDNFAHQSISVQMFALSWGALVNDACHILNDNINLSVKVLEINGFYGILSSKPAPQLMMQQFELRERLDEESDLISFLKDVQSIQKKCVENLSKSHKNEAFEEAKNLTVELQFLTKFVKDIKRN
jgi:molecular chaperone HscB